MGEEKVFMIWSDGMEKFCIGEKSSIRNAMEKINGNLTSSAVVIEDSGKVLGLITDGDIRRALLSGMGLGDSIKGIYSRNIKSLSFDSGKRKAKELMLKFKIRQLPVLNSKGRLEKLYFLDDILSYDKKEEWVVIQAGGLGSRLGKLTENIPKPLLKIGEKPLLEHIIDGFVYFGFRKFIVTLNYRGEMIEEYLGDGSRYGVEIRYVKEKKALGTAGALYMCREIIDSEDIIMVNGDILTGLDYEEFLKYHKRNDNSITVGALEHVVQIPYGVIETHKDEITGLREKPAFEFFINSGIYALKKEVINLVPENGFMDMTTVIEKGKEQGIKEMVYPVNEYWRDIGRVEDYNKTNMEAYKLL